MRLLFGELAPDAAPNGGNRLVMADGVYPGANGYRPVGQPSAIAPALAADFAGGASFVASDGTARIIAGTATNLYSLSGGAWTSMIGALSASRWQFTKFNDTGIAVYGDAPIAVNLLAGTAAVLAGSPPDAAMCATVRDFVVLGWAGGVRNSYAWSGFQDATGWTAGVNQSGTGSLLTGGDITGMAGGEYGLLFQQFRISRMSYAGPPTIWQIDEISANVGAIAPGCIAQSGRNVFFLSFRGFHMTDGNDVRPIGIERIDREFLQYAITDIREQCYATVDPRAHTVAWVMPGKMWVYNWMLDRWTTVTTDVDAAFQAVTTGTDLETLALTYPNLDTMGISLDDARFRGGDPLMVIVDSTNAAGVLEGANLAASLELPFIEPVKEGVARVSAARPICDATSGVTVTFDSRMRLGDAQSSHAFASMQASGVVPCRVSGRFMKVGLSIAAGTDWHYLQGVDLDLVAAGGRR